MYFLSMNFIFGAHMSIANGFTDALKRSHEEMTANAMQIFMKSPRGRAITKLTPQEAGEFKAYAKKIDFKFVVAHCSYLLNFAKPVVDLSFADAKQLIGEAPRSASLSSRCWALASLIDDLRGVEMLGGAGVVLHVGKSLELSQLDAFDFLIKNLKKILAETEDIGAKIILENTAGQGTEMGRSFEELAEIYDSLGQSKKIGFCLDTCHSWAWGYDWSNADAVLKDFDRVLGLKNLTLIHFNDAMKERGSRVDRHANLGDGCIGEKSLCAIAKFAAEHSIPLILETPENKGKTHIDDFNFVRSHCHSR